MNHKNALIPLATIITLVFLSINLGKVKYTFIESKRELPIYCVDRDDKKIAITFDVSWGEDNTEEILDILDKYNVKATFFVVGKWIDQYPEKVKEIDRRGHELGNHSNTHPNMTSISKSKIINEIEITDSKLIKLTGKMPKLFRCPNGSYNNTVIQTVKSTNHYCIQWNVDSIDWKNEGADLEYNRIINKTTPGSILLFHNYGKYTPQNLPKIIEKLTSEGYKFVKVSQLIYNSNYYIDNQGKQILYK